LDEELADFRFEPSADPHHAVVIPIYV